MAADQYIYHVTLTTGHAAHQYRSSVGNDAIVALADTLDAMLLGGHPDVPGCPGYIVDGAQSGYALIATVWRGPWETRAAIVTTAIALKSRSAPALWRRLHQDAVLPCQTNPDHPPAAPWQADRLEIGALNNTEALRWTGDFCRSLAWAWHDYRMGG